MRYIGIIGLSALLILMGHVMVPTVKEAKIAQNQYIELVNNTKSESSTESERGTEPESNKEPESNTESEHNTEPETELKEIVVTSTKVAYPNAARSYDDTKAVTLEVTCEGKPEGIVIEAIGISEQSNVGIWKVEANYQMKGEGKENYNLRVVENTLRIRILPKVLKVEIANAYKSYFAENTIENLTFEEGMERIHIVGFVKDGKGTDEKPKKFEMPEVVIDERVIQKDSLMYEKGKVREYRNALILKTDGKGHVVGNPTSNYSYDLDIASKNYRPGSTFLTSSNIVEGVDYEVRGDKEGVLYKAETGVRWVQKGAAICIIPYAESGFETGTSSKPIVEDGSDIFVLERRDNLGNLQAVSLPTTLAYSVDGEGPKGKMLVDGKDVTAGEGKQEEKVYYAESVAVELTQLSDYQSGMRLVQWRTEKGGLWKEGDIPKLTQEGSYQIDVRLEDYVGNVSYMTSQKIVIDQSAPSLTLGGIAHQSANRGEVSLKVTCEDDYYLTNSLKVLWKSEKSGMRKVKGKSTKKGKGIDIEFEDIPHLKEWDDYYTITVKAKDLAGNEAVKTIEFSINRFGSVYAVELKTAKQLEKFYVKEEFPVVIREINIDFLETSKITVSSEEGVRVLLENQDYKVVKKGQERKWKEYSYLIEAANFQKEGIYSVITSSKDRAKNESDNKMQQKNIEFAIDKTGPSVIVVGVENQKIYYTNEKEIAIESRDYLGLAEMKVYLDDVQVKISNQSEERLQLTAKNGWQTLVVLATDRAGNTTREERSFYLTENKEVNLTPPVQKPYQKAYQKNYQQRIYVAEKEETFAKPQNGAPQSIQKEEQEQNIKVPILMVLLVFICTGGGLIFLRYKRHKM